MRISHKMLWSQRWGNTIIAGNSTTQVQLFVRLGRIHKAVHINVSGAKMKGCVWRKRVQVVNVFEMYETALEDSFRLSGYYYLNE